jgi:hypothetical protein
MYSLVPFMYVSSHLESVTSLASGVLLPHTVYSTESFYVIMHCYYKLHDEVHATFTIFSQLKKIDRNKTCGNRTSAD